MIFLFKLPFVNFKLLKKIIKNRSNKAIKTWYRSCTIIPLMINKVFLVHNGKRFIPVYINDRMLFHKLGEFSFTRRFLKHKTKDKKLISK